MKTALLFTVMFCTGCTATKAERYEAGKKIWDNFKIANECMQQSDELYDDTRPLLDGFIFHQPSWRKYTKWVCKNGDIYFSPYDH